MKLIVSPEKMYLEFATPSEVAELLAMLSLVMDEDVADQAVRDAIVAQMQMGKDCKEVN